MNISFLNMIMNYRSDSDEVFRYLSENLKRIIEKILRNRILTPFQVFPEMPADLTVYQVQIGYSEIGFDQRVFGQDP